MTELDEKDLDRVDAYHRGELNTTEEADLRERIGRDPAFAEIVRQQEILLRALEPTAEELTERTAFKTRFQARQQQRNSANVMEALKEPRKGVAKTRRLTRWLAGAAAVLLIGVAAYWISTKTFFTDIPPQAAAVPYFTPLNRIAGRMGTTPATEQELTAAYRAYDIGDYATAAPLLNSPTLVAADSLNLLFGAVAELGLGKAETALLTLENLRQTRFYPENQAEIDFYLALAYLDIGEQAKALELLQAVKVLPGAYGEAATEALLEFEN